MSIDQLANRVRTIARRSAALRSEFGQALEDDGALIDLLERNPIAAWVEGQGTGGRRYFAYSGNRFATTFSIAERQRDAAVNLVGELAEWRLAQYLSRRLSESGADRIVCKVSHAGDRPILFLPPRERTPGIPEGWVDVQIDGVTHQAKFAKIAVNVMHAPGEETNVLPNVLRGWYGEHAGQPGTSHRALFERARDGYRLSPLKSDAPSVAAPRLWTAYPRAKAAELLGVDLKGFEAQSGVVDRPGMLLLFVTLDKAGKPEAHRYEDAFVSPMEFRWQSQNRNRRESRIGQMIAQRGTPPETIHLLARARAKGQGGKTEPFTYCGPLTFERWEGDKPITVWWRLAEPVPEGQRALLRVPNGLAGP